MVTMKTVWIATVVAVALTIGCDLPPDEPTESKHCQEPLESMTLCLDQSGAPMFKNDSTCAVCLPLSLNDCLIANHTAPLCVSDCGQCAP